MRLIRGHYGLVHGQKTTFKKEMRWYRITDPPDTDPVRLPGVTSILDVTMPQSRRDALVRAELTNPLNYALNREAAIAKGTAIDTWFKKCLLNGRLYGAPHPVERQCQRLRPLVRNLIQVGDQVWADERVHHIDLGYAGTLDVVATLPTGQRAVIELKSSAYTIWPEAVAEATLQAAAYAQAWNKLHPDNSTAAIVTYHVTPYLAHGHMTTGPALTKAIAAWNKRLQQFASRYSAMEL
ncbi:hypothetical protein IQ273_31285 [Nodosilinea sp. LEGE 07298]|uniref:hypothetical protein n=1 Tax=Nodosilinea sp. LEGE 07298 TaxID=2777970 RepID=UPI0018814E99|nr:hypothetical protein [Nodosilinea sp. LEGE 07298]MBE9113857.1 hypothetical protein [Nodosilinea sp. LEGE 07298]